MVFSDLFFLYVFIPLFALCYILFNKNIVLCFFSVIFYAWGEPIYVFLMLFSVFINYIVGLKIDSIKSAKNDLNIYGKSRKKTKSLKFDFNINEKDVLILGIIFNILLIVIFKYTNYLAKIFFNAKTNIALPIGISFWTFQSISYIVDVYNNKSNAQKSYYKLLLYISMFPQLIAGPIVRYSTIAEGIDNRKITTNDLFEGISRFIFGLSKKVLIANQLSIVVNTLLSADFTVLSKFGAFVGIFCYVLQIYFDFSAYSDMAIGMGRCMGFKFLENFNYPLISKSMTEFWRRWHISLSTFFRDYVYIPLGGNKKHQIFNILFVWTLTGFWHGANTNYLFWGLFLGIVIILEKLFNNFVTKNILLNFENAILNILKSIISHIYAIIIVFISFILFYFESFSKLKNYILIFIKNNPIVDTISYNIFLNNIYIIIIAIVLAMPVYYYINKTILQYKNKKILIVYQVLKTLVLLFLLILSTFYLIGETNNPFLYTRF